MTRSAAEIDELVEKLYAQVQKMAEEFAPCRKRPKRTPDISDLVKADLRKYFKNH